MCIWAYMLIFIHLWLSDWYSLSTFYSWFMFTFDMFIYVLTKSALAFGTPSSCSFVSSIMLVSYLSLHRMMQHHYSPLLLTDLPELDTQAANMSGCTVFVHSTGGSYTCCSLLGPNCSPELSRIRLLVILQPAATHTHAHTLPNTDSTAAAAASLTYHCCAKYPVIARGSGTGSARHSCVQYRLRTQT